MQKNVLNTDLTGKVAVVTGAGAAAAIDRAQPRSMASHRPFRYAAPRARSYRP